jgi:hypothetical protein
MSSQLTVESRLLNTLSGDAPDPCLLIEAGLLEDDAAVGGGGTALFHLQRSTTRCFDRGQCARRSTAYTVSQFA